MKKALSFILIGTLAVTSVIGVTTALSKRCANDIETTRPTITQSATQNVNETQKIVETQKVAETQKVVETQSSTTAQTNKAESNKASVTTSATSQKNEQKKIVYYDTTDNSMVMPNLIGLWGDLDNGGYCVSIKNQDGNTIDFVIESRNQANTKIATADVSVTLETYYDENGQLSGSSSFGYYDSFGSGGTGHIVISGNMLYLTVNEEFNPCASWSVGNGTGTYIRV